MLFDGADADERAGEDAERVERGHYRVHVSPAPCGADRTDEQGECGQDDEAQPFEDVVDAAGDEPVWHVAGGCRRPFARLDCMATPGRTDNRCRCRTLSP